MCIRDRSSLGFGRHIYPEQVPTEGITHITLSDVAYARSGGYKIKLLGRSIRRESDGKVCATSESVMWVMPSVRCV